jgi:tetratricopeptide (TPR) repeat protein
MRAFVPLVTALMVGLLPGFVAAESVGETVVVIEPAPIRVGDNTVGTVSPGTSLRVLRVNGDWLWISHRAVGWIEKKHVTTQDHAIEIFTKEIEKNPSDSAPYVRRGNVWFSKDELDIALADYSEAIRENPKSESAYHNRGNCWLAKGNRNKAIHDYTEALRLAPNDSALLYSRGLAWVKEGDLNQAISDYTAAIQVSPKFAKAYDNRGLVWQRMGQFEKALADFTEALTINPENVAAHAGLALIYAAAPDPKFRDSRKAIENARQACRMTKWKRPGVLETLAVALAEAHDFDKAVEMEARAMSLAPADAKAGYQSRIALFKAHTPYRLASRPVNAHVSHASPVPPLPVAISRAGRESADRRTENARTLDGT